MLRTSNVHLILLINTSMLASVNIRCVRNVVKFPSRLRSVAYRKQNLSAHISLSIFPSFPSPLLFPSPPPFPVLAHPHLSVPSAYVSHRFIRLLHSCIISVESSVMICFVKRFNNGRSEERFELNATD